MSRAVLVTGAAGAIGQAICHKFMKENWRVIGLDIRKARVTKPGMPLLCADLARMVENEAYKWAVMEEIRSLLDGAPINAIVNNAAIQITGRFEDIEVSDWLLCVSVNLLAPVCLTRMFLDDLIRNGGSVVNMGSIHSQLTKPEFSAYATTKSALAGLTRALAVELGDRVAVNIVEPAAVNTGMLIDGLGGESNLKKVIDKHPSRSIGDPDLIAEAVYFLGEKGKGYMNGASLRVDGGIRSRLHE